MIVLHRHKLYNIYIYRLMQMYVHITVVCVCVRWTTKPKQTNPKKGMIFFLKV